MKWFPYKTQINAVFSYLVLAPFLSVALLTFFCFWPNQAFSAQIITNSEVYLNNERKFSENVYVGAGQTIIEGRIEEDLVVISGSAKITGIIDGDVLVLGGNAEFSGEVMGDLRMIGGEVHVSGKIGGDVMAIGGKVIISENAIINREIFVAGGQVEINNKFSNQLKIVSSKVKLNSIISGNSEITTYKLIANKSSDISGNFSYYAPQKISVEDGAKINANLTYNKINSFQDTGIVKRIVVNFMNFWFILRIVSTLVLAFILVYVFKVFSQEVTNLSTVSFSSFIKSFLLGAITPILLVAGTIVLFVSLIGLPIGFLLILSYIFILSIAPAVSAIFVGNWLIGAFKNKFKFDEQYNLDKVDFKDAVFGAIILTAVQFIPFVGPAIRLVVFFVALGSIVRAIRLKIIK